LLDLHLPKIHGVEVLKKIKSHRWIQHVSAIVFICSGGHPNIKKYDALGADGYILKPLNFGNFAGAIVNLGFHWSLLAYSAIQNAIGS